MPRPQRGPAVKACLFRKDEFRYDAASDRYVCPTGQRLHPYSSSLLRGLTKINYTNKLACDDCAIRSRCTGGRLRTVSRLQNEAVLDRMQTRLAKRPDVLTRRREAVECESAWRLTSYRRRRLTPRIACDDIDAIGESVLSSGSRLDTEKGQTSEPIHTQGRFLTLIASRLLELCCCRLDQTAQHFGYAPGLSDAAARCEGRLGVKHLAD
jgi:hypothetical protein